MKKKNTKTIKKTKGRSINKKTLKENKKIIMVTKRMINKLKGKRFDIIKFGKLLKSIEVDILDKCTDEELIKIENSFNSNTEMNPKYELIMHLLTIPFDVNKKSIDFKPVYKPNDKGSCMKKDYTFKRDLGSGYFGEVKLLEKDGKKYALKKIKLISSDPYLTLDMQVQAVKDEIKILEQISYLDISPKLYNYYMCKEGKDTSIYLLMEYIEGETLESYVKTKVVSEQLKNKIKKVFNKLHKNGFVHLDVHRGNVMIGKNGKVYLIDFGFSKTVDEYLETEFRNLFNDRMKQESIKRILAKCLIELNVI